MPPLRIGDVLAGFCGGAFGRDYWSDEGRVEAIGSDWTIVRDDNGRSGWPGATQSGSWSTGREPSESD